LPCWIRGATQVITSDWKPTNIFNLIEYEKITIVKTIPTILLRLLSYPKIGEHDRSSLRKIIYGVSPMPVEKLKTAISIFGQIFVGNYGQVEAPMTIATLSKEDHMIDDSPEKTARLASAGRPYTFVNVKLVDDDNNEVPCGHEGEVVVSSDHVMDGYWNKSKKETEESLKNGWLHTRDIGRFDEKGYLFLVDRKNEMIITGGLNVYPSEVEQALYKHPAVQEAAVIGIPDADWGEAIKAFVVLKPGMTATEDDLIDICVNTLASYKKPKSIEFRENLPKSNVGKILRKTIKETYWKGYQR
jgi:acyl-CoA synthetase (AMP-forming)/AMP-acid ligase II